MSDRGMFGQLGPELWESHPPVWRADEDDTLVCCRVRRETHDVKSFVFRSRKQSLFRFRPGQFITLELQIDGEAINRCYTISSAPTRPDTLSITVKRVPGGKVSNWLHDNLKPGSEIRVLGPAGEFSCSHHPAPKYLFLSGGSGVTPLMSMSRAHYEVGEDADIVFVHSARTPRDIIFRRELAMMSHGLEHFRTAFVCEQVGEEREWSAPTGYLSLPLLKSIAPDFAQREVFCCGPEPYMTAVRAMLREAGFDMAHYHEESFCFEREMPADEAAPAEQAATGAQSAAHDGAFRIELTQSGRTIECAPTQNILDAARTAGLRLPSSCSKGMCGTCKSKMLSGKVHMEHGGGIRQREIDQGMILPCCSKPLSDITLER